MLNNFVPLKSEQYDIEECFDVSKIKNELGMGFYVAYNLLSCLRPALWSVPAIDSSSITDFKFTFFSCTRLTSIPQLDTSKGTNFCRMFYGCSGLTSIPQLDTSKGTDFSGMFFGCSGLTSIPQLDTSKGTNFSDMFYGCSGLTSIPQLDTSKGTDFSGMFEECKNIKAVHLKMANCRSMSNAFDGCEALQAVTGIDLAGSEYIHALFRKCSSLTSLSAMCVSQVVDASMAFSECATLSTLGTENVPDADGNLVAPWQFKVSIDFGHCPLDKASIECVMNNIQTVTTTQTLKISKTSALNICGQTDKSYDYTSDTHYQEMMKICTDKGWTVAVNSSY